MRPLTSDELKLLLERGLEALPDRNAAEVVESLALEVSERRVAEAPRPDASWRPLRDVPTDLWAALWTGVNNYAQACGGDTSRATFGAHREDSVAEVESAVEACMLRSLYDRAPVDRALLRDALEELRVAVRWAGPGFNMVEWLQRATAILRRAAEAGIGEG
jgi:hypothetical protein